LIYETTCTPFWIERKYSFQEPACGTVIRHVPAFFIQCLDFWLRKNVNEPEKVSHALHRSGHAPLQPANNSRHEERPFFTFLFSLFSVEDFICLLGIFNISTPYTG
jgi:hypothetical protein